MPHDPPQNLKQRRVSFRGRGADFRDRRVPWPVVDQVLGGFLGGCAVFVAAAHLWWEVVRVSVVVGLDCEVGGV